MSLNGGIWRITDCDEKNPCVIIQSPFVDYPFINAELIPVSMGLSHLKMRSCKTPSPFNLFFHTLSFFLIVFPSAGFTP